MNYLKDKIISLECLMLMLFIVIWNTISFYTNLFPSMYLIFMRIKYMILNEGFLYNMFITIAIAMVSLLLAVIISLMLSYAIKAPKINKVFTIIVDTLILFRFANIMASYFLLKGPIPTDYLKIFVVIYCIIPWFLVSMKSVIRDIPDHYYDLYRTLGYSEWETWYEVVVVGTRSQVYDTILSISALSITVLTAVEPSLMSQKGLGTILFYSKRSTDLDGILIVLISTIVAGIVIQPIVRFLKRLDCKYAKGEI